METAGYKEPIIHTFLRAGEQLGYKIGDTNGEMEDQGFSEIHRTQYNGLRAGTYKAFAEKHVGKNLTVLTYTQVTGVS